MSIKRTRQEFEYEFLNNVDSRLVANYLMLFSGATETPPPSTYSAVASDTERVFECKTCNRRFSSFQALGGHRASHKKPKINGPAQSSSENSTISNENTTTSFSSAPAKKKTKHECSICGAEFAMGQALGGHMRRHRAGMMMEQGLPPPTGLSLSWRPVMEEKKVGGEVESTLCLDLCL